MSSIKGTNVLAPVVPFDTTDAHASHEARYGKGGYRSVADITERDAIPALRREAGMLVCVLADGKVWKLGSDLATWTEFKSGASSWDDLAGKPTAFTPASHTHTSSQITDFASAVAAVAPPTTDASLLTSGTLSSSRLPASVVLTTDSRLSDARTPLSHTHSIANVSGLQAALDAKATPSDVTAAVAAVVNAAPSSLDTLAELAAALNNDASFSATVTNAIAAKAPTNSPAFTGTVSGITKGMVGLGNVDNTSDASKPVSTAQAAANSAIASAAASDATTKANAVQAYAIQRVNHTGTQTASTISDFAAAVVAAAPPTTNASLLTSGTLADARLSANVVLTSDSRLSDARTPTAHVHAVADVTGLQTALDGKQAAGSYAAASHTHTASQVSGLAAVATSGSYADLTNKPTIPAAVTTLPASSITGLATIATSGSYTDLTNKPTIPSAYTLPAATSSVLGGVKQGANVTIGADGTISVAAPVTTLAAGAITGLATVATTGAYADLSGRPTLGTAAAASSSDFAAASHTHGLSSLTQSGATSGQVITWNGSAWAAAAPFTSLAAYATSASFPATGSASVLYLASDSSKLYQFASGVYVEIG